MSSLRSLSQKTKILGLNVFARRFGRQTFYSKFLAANHNSGFEFKLIYVRTYLETMQINCMSIKTGKQIVIVFRNHSNLLGLGQNFFNHIFVAIQNYNSMFRIINFSQDLQKISSNYDKAQRKVYAIKYQSLTGYQVTQFRLLKKWPFLYITQKLFR